MFKSSAGQRVMVDKTSKMWCLMPTVLIQIFCQILYFCDCPLLKYMCTQKGFLIFHSVSTETGPGPSEKPHLFHYKCSYLQCGNLVHRKLNFDILCIPTIFHFLFLKNW